jgi:Na+/melibiose symporter-like transporter
MSAAAGQPSLAIFGVSLIASLSPYLTAIAIALLAANAYTLNRRLKHLISKTLKP